jgi:hypothetical protein
MTTKNYVFYIIFYFSFIMRATAFTSQNSSLKDMSPVDKSGGANAVNFKIDNEVSSSHMHGIIVRWIDQEHAQVGTQTLNRRAVDIHPILAAMDPALTFQAPEISPHPSIRPFLGQKHGTCIHDWLVPV